MNFLGKTSKTLPPIITNEISNLVKDEQVDAKEFFSSFIGPQKDIEAATAFLSLEYKGTRRKDMKSRARQGMIHHPYQWPKGIPKILPKRGLKFADVKVSHKMWLKYMRMLFNISSDKNFQSSIHCEPSSKHYDLFSSNVNKIDLHGAHLRVIRSRVPSCVGISGIVVLETQNVFQLIGENDVIKTVQKKISQFQFTVDNYEFTFYGKDMLIRPFIRSLHKRKTPMFNML